MYQLCFVKCRRFEYRSAHRVVVMSEQNKRIFTLDFVRDRIDNLPVLASVVEELRLLSPMSQIERYLIGVLESWSVGVLK